MQSNPVNCFCIIPRPVALIRVALDLIEEASISDYLDIYDKSNFNRCRSLTFKSPLYHKVSNHDIRRLASRIQRLKLLSIVNFNLVKLNSSNMTRLSSSLKHLRSLKSLSILLDASLRVEQYKGLQNLFKCMKDLRSLDSLKMNFCFNLAINDQSLYQLSSALRAQSSLYELQLNFWGCTNMNDDAVLLISNSLRHSANLMILKLDISECKNITNKGLDSLSEIIRHIPKLSTLDLNLSCCRRIDEEGLVKLQKSLQNLKGLSHVNLNFVSTSAGYELAKRLGLELSKMSSLLTMTINHQIIKH